MIKVLTILFLLNFVSMFVIMKHNKNNFKIKDIAFFEDPPLNNSAKKFDFDDEPVYVVIGNTFMKNDQIIKDIENSNIKFKFVNIEDSKIIHKYVDTEYIISNSPSLKLSEMLFFENEKEITYFDMYYILLKKNITG
jgi:hypothetical protein